MAIKLLSSNVDPSTNDTILGIKIEQFNNLLEREVFQRVVEIVAENYVSQNYVEIAKQLDQRAVATLAVAHASRIAAESSMAKDFAKAAEDLRGIVGAELERRRRI